MKAVIFDFDGVILDSEPQHFESFSELMRRHKIPFDETPQEVTGIPARENIRRVHEKAGITVSAKQIEALNLERDEIYLDVILKTARSLPGATELVLSLKKSGYPLALASSTNTWLLELLLPKIGLENAFDAVVGGDQVRHGKPSPDIFLKAAEKLRVPAKECVVIEDSNAGLLGAKKAGMKVVMVENRRIQQEKRKADAFVTSLSGVTPFFLASI
ncbi:HAD family phosphatase [Candidatus Micrarchaeota archaeon]|nr:HAD family phosphatase [Candidatus Micrarchaeota archaeon]